jgi:hypothetical protein
MTSEYWATPFEVHLAAMKFNCIIHLFHHDDSTDATMHCCFQPEDRSRSSGSTPPPIIFLQSKLENGEFWFQWCRVRPKLFCADTLKDALSLWLSQDDIRPITAHLLGADEKDFIRKCSKLLKRAFGEHRQNQPNDEVIECILCDWLFLPSFLV